MWGPTSCCLCLLVAAAAAYPHNQDGAEVPLSQEPTPASQHFFPSFTSLFSNHPLGHSRPPVFDDPPSNHRPRHVPYALQQANSFQGTPGSFNSYQQASQPKSSVSADSSVLGSGNFGVIRGGTFYEDDYDSEDYFSPYNGHGHGRPSNNYFNHQPAHASTAGDFFANFRDFADITAPKSAYSQFHVVYVNRNGSEVRGDKPRNILEQLARLDEPQKKRKGVDAKAKLSALKQQREDKLRGKKQGLRPGKSHEEPLLALS